MARQSISFTNPNNDWLKAQIESEEYTSKSDVINDLIRKARAQENDLALIRARLIHAEQSGFTSMTQDEILTKSKDDLRHNGTLQT